MILNLSKKSLLLFACSLLIIAVIIGDYLTGPSIQFPILFAIPVLLISWYYGVKVGLAISIVLPASRLLLNYLWQVEYPVLTEVANYITRVILLSVLGFLTARVSAQTQKLNRRIKILEGFLPICSFCKKIRTSQGDWEQMESYITKHSEAQFSHGLCPKCAKKEYGLNEDEIHNNQ